MTIEVGTFHLPIRNFLVERYVIFLLAFVQCFDNEFDDKQTL